MDKPIIYRVSLTPETFQSLWQLTIGDVFNTHAAGEQLRAEGWTFASTTPVSSAEPRSDAYWQCGHRVYDVVPFVPERECQWCHGTGTISDGYELWPCVHCEAQPAPEVQPQ